MMKKDLGRVSLAIGREASDQATRSPSFGFVFNAGSADGLVRIRFAAPKSGTGRPRSPAVEARTKRLLLSGLEKNDPRSHTKPTTKAISLRVFVDRSCSKQKN